MTTIKKKVKERRYFCCSCINICQLWTAGSESWWCQRKLALNMFFCHSLNRACIVKFCLHPGDNLASLNSIQITLRAVAENITCSTSKEAKKWYSGLEAHKYMTALEIRWYKQKCKHAGSVQRYKRWERIQHIHPYLWEPDKRLWFTAAGRHQILRNESCHLQQCGLQASLSAPCPSSDITAAIPVSHIKLLPIIDLETSRRNVFVLSIVASARHTCCKLGGLLYCKATVTVMSLENKWRKKWNYIIKDNEELCD